MFNIPPVTVWAVLRAAFFNKWVALVTFLFAIIGVLDFVDSHVAPKLPSFKASWDRYYVLPHFTWQTWVMLACVALFIVGLHGAYSYARNYYEVSMQIEDLYCKPRVSVDHFEDEPGFWGLKTAGGKHYRVLRVRVTNDGGEPLYHLKAQLRLSNKWHSYSNVNLTLIEESLPIIREILQRHNGNILPKPQTTFSLHRGEQQFVNVALQENVDGKWNGAELCLSAIGVDNYSNGLNVQEPVEFSVIVMGGLYPPYSKSFVLFLDDKGVLRMKTAEIH